MFLGAACGGSNKPVPVVVGTTAHGISADDSQSLIRSYWQVSKTNCTSVALTKAILAKYGSASSAFSSFKHEGAVTTVIRSNGAPLSVTDAEVTTAANEIGVEHDESPTYVQASILFALLAKACQNDCNSSAPAVCVAGGGRTCSTYDQAVGYLNESLKWDSPLQLLGMKEGVDFSVLKGWKGSRWMHINDFVGTGGACVAATPWHTYFVASGYYDRYGVPVPFSHHSSKLGFEALHAYCLGDAVLKADESKTQDEAMHMKDEQ